MSDDPRVFRVYLAWFGPGLVKVGITAEERGDARLLEQGALAFTWLGRGALMAARRTEEVLGAALGVPDRIPYAAKRLARAALQGADERADEGADERAAERAGEVERLYGRALAVPDWGETLERLPLDVRDHGEVFGLRRVDRIDGVVSELVDGGVVRGALLAVAGPDLHLRVPDGRHIVLDSRLVAGWELVACHEGGAPLTVPVGPRRPVSVVQGGLF